MRKGGSPPPQIDPTIFSGRPPPEIAMNDTIELPRMADLAAGLVMSTARTQDGGGQLRADERKQSILDIPSPLIEESAVAAQLATTAIRIREGARACA